MGRQKDQTPNHESKSCAVCGREIEWRKKWEKNWADVKYCSDRCRSARSTKDTYEADILGILATRAHDKTMCPSEVLSEADKQKPEMMEKVREAARRLVAKGSIEIVQGGKPVDPSAFRGPIRLRLVRK